jgi:RNA:NAD 2'-phosphotransferase (TPT1/KptA family)
MVLRHRPESAGRTLDANGWVPVADGHVFHRSANGVWLTSAVPPAYLSTKAQTSKEPSLHKGRAARERLA